MSYCQKHSPSSFRSNEADDTPSVYRFTNVTPPHPPTPPSQAPADAYKTRGNSFLRLPPAIFSVYIFEEETKTPLMSQHTQRETPLRAPHLTYKTKNCAAPPAPPPPPAFLIKKTPHLKSTRLALARPQQCATSAPLNPTPPRVGYYTTSTHSTQA